MMARHGCVPSIAASCVVLCLACGESAGTPSTDGLDAGPADASAGDEALAMDVMVARDAPATPLPGADAMAFPDALHEPEASMSVTGGPISTDASLSDSDVAVDASYSDSDEGADASFSDSGDAAAADAQAMRDAAPDGDAGDGSLPADRFVTSVVSFTPGPCAGFGQSEMPEIVEGPPHGGGATQGSVDVVSLGVGGEITVSFAPNAIVDGPGPDFIVFENPFDIGGLPEKPYAELGEVSVSDDGATWVTYRCTATSYPYGSCAGWHPVNSAPGNGISPVDPSTAGGDAFDLADLGITHARFVRIRDVSHESCPDAGGSTSDGFDLDAVSIVNAEMQ